MSEVDLIGKQIGQYKITWLIGQGGMATVYRATQPGVDRLVAIKVMSAELGRDPQFTERFKREARTIAKLEHPHILPAIEFGQQDDFLYLVMRLVDGGSLDDKIHKNTLTIARTSEILNQIGPALDYAHRRGIVHRDLKPNNVLLDRDGNAYLADFGLASMPNAGSSLTTTGMVLGTPTYMSPEQWRGETVDSRADVYALGIMLYEMITGTVPFRADTVFGLMHKHLDAEVPSVASHRTDIPEVVSARIDEIIAKAMAKKPGQRYASAGDLTADFAPLSGAPSNRPQAIQAPPPTPTLRFEPPPSPVIPSPQPKLDAFRAQPQAISKNPTSSQNSSLVVAALVGLLLIGVAGAIFMLMPKPSTIGIPTLMSLEQNVNSLVIVTREPLKTLTPTPTPLETATPFASATRLPSSTPVPATIVPTKLPKPTQVAKKKLAYQQGTLDFSDQFTKTLNWQGASAKLIAGKYLQISAAPPDNKTNTYMSLAKMTTGKSYDDFFASAVFKITPTDKPAGAAIYFHWKDNSNYYLAGLFKSGTKGQFVVQSLKNGVLTNMMPSVQVTTADTNTIEILSAGKTDTFWLNGVKVGQIREPETQVGTFALAAVSFGVVPDVVTVYWDNFEIYK
jgi:serine/threonine protein kinase